MDNQNLTQDPNLPNTTPLQAQETPVPPPSTPQPTSPNSTPPVNKPSQTKNTQTLIAVLLLLFVYPVGLLYVWIATKWPKWVKFVLTLPILLAILGIAIAVFVAIKSPGRPPSSSSSMQSTTTPTPAISAAIIEGDQIVNKDGGYNFTLPKPWKAKISSYSKTDIVFGENFLNDFGIGRIEVSSSNKSLSDALNHQAKGQFSEPTPITIDNIPGVIQDFNGEFKGKVAIVYKDRKTYGISILSDNPDDLKKYQEILASFKFTN